MAILQIKDSNGNWREIVALKGDVGPIGETPEIELKATTLPAGSAATVTKSGTVEHPVFTLGIPKGETPTDVVKTVNNQAPDASGNVNVNVDFTVTKESVTTALGYTPLQTAPVTSVDGKTGAVSLANVYQPKGNYLTSAPVTSVDGKTGAVSLADVYQPKGNYLTSAPVTSVMGMTGAVTGLVKSVNGNTPVDGDVTVDIPNGVHVGTKAPTDEETSVWVDLDSDAIQPVMKVNGQVPDANGEVTISSVANATNATKATQDASGNVIASTYATKTEAGQRILMSGSRGTLAGYNTPVSSSTAVTINGSSNDDTIVTAAVAVTISNGSSGQTWTKTVALQNASATVSLGTSWKWMGGEVPTISANSILVVKWCGTFGIANLVAGA